jgi:hypothetical protein
MAGPHVVGLVALMISANPELAGEVDIIESIIKLTSDKKTTTQSCGGSNGVLVPNNTYGHGRVNALNAINYVLANPLHQVEILSSDFVILNYNNTLVLTSPNNTRYKINVDNSGNIFTSPYTSNSINDVEIRNASLVFNDSSFGMVVKSGNSSFWRMKSDINGLLFSQNISTLPPIRITQEGGNVIVASSDEGMILRNSNTCFKFKVDNNGNLISSITACN